MTAEDHRPGPLRTLTHQLIAGHLSRRQFVERATALGLGASAAITVAHAVTAQTPSPAASPAAPASGRPSVGTEGQTRGAGGDIRFLIWQTPTHLSPHTSTGSKDTFAGTLVLEPLVHYLPDTSLSPNLVTEIPSVENGLLAEDLTSVTYRLIPGITWSDGEPFTARDVVFTWEWITNPDNAATSIGNYTAITQAEAIDDLTVKLSFAGPNPFWTLPFVGTTSGHVYPEHVLGSGGVSIDEFQLKPIGTGPFVVESFTPNDTGVFAINEAYREPNKPYFSRITVSGGGDAVSAARAAIQTGEVDYAWGIGAEPEILNSLVTDNSPGTYLTGTGGSVEAIYFNFSDPNTEVDGQRSEKNTPHPFFSDLRVRQAVVAAIDRQLIADQFYLGGDIEPAVSNFISGIPDIESPNTELGFDPDHARALLDEAGWVLDGNVRKKDGIELAIRYQTSTSSIRQKIQAVVKSNLEDIGFTVELLQVDSAIFFDSAAGNDQNYPHFYTDIEQFTSPYAAPRPISSFLPWYAGEDGSLIAQEANGWSARNFTRYQNPDFDALFESAQVETDPDAFIQAFIDLNDALYLDAAVIPLIRSVPKIGVSRKLNFENIGISQFNHDSWNVANWNHAPNE